MSPAPDLKLPPDAPQWMHRHPRLVLTACTGILLLIVLFVIGLFHFFINRSFRHSAPYRHAFAVAQADPRVIAALGAPIEDGRWIQGRRVGLEAAQDGEIDVSVALYGSRKRARMFVSGEKRSGRWTTSARIEVDGEPASIDLPMR